jgi:anti-sigma B factor antagonist
VGDVVDQAREHAHESVVLSAAAADGPEGEPETALAGVHLEGHGSVVARVQCAQDGKLEIVHALVREVEPAADAADHEGRDAAEARVGGHREDDPVPHSDHRLDSPVVTMPGDFDVRSETMPAGAAVVRVSGELDLATAPRLEEALAEQAADPVVVDLSDCTFLDSAGMGVLLASTRALRESGRSLRVATADPRILRVLEITAVDTLIAVYPDVEGAL